MKVLIGRATMSSFFICKSSLHIFGLNVLRLICFDTETFSRPNISTDKRLRHNSLVRLTTREFSEIMTLLQHITCKEIKVLKQNNRWSNDVDYSLWNFFDRKLINYKNIKFTGTKNRRPTDCSTFSRCTQCH